MSAPHFRLVYRRDFVGQKHTGNGKVFVRWDPSAQEVEVPSAMLVETLHDPGSVAQVRVTFAASCSVEYSGEQA